MLFMGITMTYTSCRGRSGAKAVEVIEKTFEKGAKYGDDAVRAYDGLNNPNKATNANLKICMICHGSGHFLENCEYCNGSGRDYYGNICNICSGHGEIQYKCTACSGTGHIHTKINK